MEYFGFSDESNYTNGDYRSIALVVMPKKLCLEFQNKMNAVLEKYNIKITSFKWKKIKNETKVNALIEILEILFPYINCGLIKIEVLTWNINDTRHNIVKRDDSKNISYMYDKLIKDYVNRHLKKEDVLHLCPDQNSAIDWGTLEEILVNQGIFNEKYVKEFSMVVGSNKVFINESSTSKQPIIQIADIFAGIARSSFEDYDVYERWLDPQQQLLVGTPPKPTVRQKYRFKIYKIIDEWCKKNKLSVSLRENRGFHSYKPSYPLNFWIYEPQNKKDKAPRR